MSLLECPGTTSTFHETMNLRLKMGVSMALKGLGVIV